MLKHAPSLKTSTNKKSVDDPHVYAAGARLALMVAIFGEAAERMQVILLTLP